MVYNKHLIALCTEGTTTLCIWSARPYCRVQWATQEPQLVMCKGVKRASMARSCSNISTDHRLWHSTYDKQTKLAYFARDHETTSKSIPQPLTLRYAMLVSVAIVLIRNPQVIRKPHVNRGANLQIQT